jgi:hypothetical protein
VAERVRVREITSDEGQRLLWILRRSTGSVVKWRRAQMVLLRAQGMPVPKIAEVTFTSPDRVRDVIHNFNADGFDALYPRYRGGRPPTFTPAQRRAIKQLALSRPDRPRAAILDLEPDQAGRLPGRRGAEPDRGAVHRAALLHPRWHRSPLTSRAGQHDPPLPGLAEPPRPRPTPRLHRQAGKHCLTWHQRRDR